MTGCVLLAGSRWASRLGFSGARPRRPGCLPGRRRSRPWRPWPGSRGFVVGVLGLASSFRCRARLRGLAGVGPLGCRRRRPPSRGPPLPSVRPAFGGRCCCGGGGRSRPGLRLRQRAARASAGPDGPNSPPLRSGAGAPPNRVVPARGVAAGAGKRRSPHRMERWGERVTCPYAGSCSRRRPPWPGWPSWRWPSWSSSATCGMADKRPGSPGAVICPGHAGRGSGRVAAGAGGAWPAYGRP